MSRDFGKLFLELSTLVADVATNVNENCGIRSPSLGFLVNRKHVPTDGLIFAAVKHEFIEVASGLRLLHEPEEDRQWRFMGHLVDGICVVCNILVLDLGKETWELLVQGAAGVEPRDSDH